MTAARLNSEKLVKALHAAYCHDATRAELLQIAATKIHDTGSPYTGVYMYMVHGGNLRLEAFQGRPTEHTGIPVGVGLCGRAVAEKRDLNIADVKSNSDYLACSIDTRSELIVLIRRGDEILGQIDIDSDEVDGFDPAEQAATQQVADGLAALL